MLLILLHSYSQLVKAVCIGIGIYSFVLSKRSVDQKRYENMKSRERMRNSNQGEYNASSRKFI
ncbi:uncharacterized protein LOC106668767 [Cimex lectularius]|uniref:Uncharacterized protein n=1 Tax=Cimex lectularius TaxID=79782 RepID=A0A8I6SCD6_CIMLE|nr:uncharacterized protein LOC106668767 [Cimex lectularius]